HRRVTEIELGHDFLRLRLMTREGAIFQPERAENHRKQRGPSIATFTCTIANSREINWTIQQLPATPRRLKAYRFDDWLNNQL
ncbi:MAG: hypothetical protein ACT6U0_12050, partial [Shinella sp.]